MTVTAAHVAIEHDGPACLDQFDWLNATARSRLEAFAACLRRWQAAHNLVSAATLDRLWTRHIADSLQLVPHCPAGARRWIDLGTGGGFPGLIVAIALADRAPVAVTLVEANRKKAAFLRRAAREVDVPVKVIGERIETVCARTAGASDEPYDVISARGLAPLARLLVLAHPLAGAESRVLLLKGQDFVHGVDEASKSWQFDLLSYKSMTDPRGRIVAISHVRPKRATPKRRDAGRTDR